MLETRRRQLQVVNWISVHNDLKGMCARFFSGFPEAINNNDFFATAKIIDETRVEISAIGSKVEIYFDYVITKDDVFGVIKCDEIFGIDQRVPLTTNYFDWEGRIYLFLGDERYSQNL